MFVGAGTTINVIAIVLGGVLGVLLGSKFAEATKSSITDLLGMVTFISAADAISAFWRTELRAALPRGWAILMIVFSDRKSTRLNSSHVKRSRMPSSA